MNTYRKILLGTKAGQGEREKRHAPKTLTLRHVKRGAAKNCQPIPDSARRLGPRESPDKRHSVPAKNH